MVSPKTQKILIVAIVLLLLGFLGYKMFINEPVTSDGTTVASSTEIVGQDILDLVGELKKVSIDQSFFSNPLFSSLQDFTQIVYPEALGRINPFATIGSDGSSSLNFSNQLQATSTKGR